MSDHVLIVDSQGDRLFIKMDPGCEPCLRQCSKATEVVASCGRVERRRRGMHQSPLGTVYLCTDDHDDVSSNKRFRTRIEIMGGAIQMLLDTREAAKAEGRSEANRLTHNLRTLCSRTSLELFNIASQEQLVSESDALSQRRVFKEALLRDTDESAAVLLRVLKNTQAMAHEFSVFERLDASRVADIQPMTHILHKVVRNVVASFYQDFQRKSIAVRLSPSETRTRFDYETFSVALYYVLDNATKYCAHSSLLNIRFENVGGLKLLLEMTSLQVDESEKEAIFTENYSGRVARRMSMHGKGIGMYLAKRLLSLGNIGIRFMPGPQLQAGFKDAGYAHNTIEIQFPESLVVTGGAKNHHPNARVSDR